MEGFITLMPWHFKCMELLPIAIPEGITVQDQMCKAWYYINTILADIKLLEENLDKMPQMIQDEVKKQTDALKADLLARMAKIEADMAALENTILQEVKAENDKFRTEINALIAEFTKQTQEAITNIENQINLALSQVNQLIADVRAAMERLDIKLSGQIVSLQNQIDEIVKELGGVEGFLINPMTGETGPQNVVFPAVYNYLRSYWTLTCGEIAASGITYGDVKAKGLTCAEVSISDRQWIVPFLYNPVTGQKAHLQTILSSLYEKAQEMPNWRWKDLDITIEDIQNANMTFEDWRENQNYLNTENIKVYERYVNGGWLGRITANLPAAVYEQETREVTLPLVNSNIIDQMWNLDCTAIDNGGEYYHLTEPYYENAFKVVVPPGLYGKEITLIFRATCIVQRRERSE